MIAEFQADAVGFPTSITWKWQVSSDGISWSDLSDDSTYSGVTTKTLSVDVVDASLNGLLYRAVADNGALTATTSAAQLNVSLA